MQRVRPPRTLNHQHQQQQQPNDRINSNTQSAPSQSTRTSKLHLRTNHHARHIPLRNHHCLERSRLRNPPLPSRPSQSQRVQQRQLVSLIPKSPPDPLSCHFTNIITFKQRSRHCLLRAPQQLQRRRDHGRHQQLRLLRLRTLVLLQRQVRERRCLHGRCAGQLGE